jgi:hypothetical protein
MLRAAKPETLWRRFSRPILAILLAILATYALNRMYILNSLERLVLDWELTSGPHQPWRPIALVLIKSQYAPLQIKYTLNRDLKQKLSLMQNSLNILVQMQNDYDLTNSALITELVGDFIGEEQVNKLNDQWEARRKGLSNSAQKIIQYDGDVSDSAFNGLKSEFLAQLGSLCEETRDMNKNYTAGVLKTLREIVEGETPQ